MLWQFLRKATTHDNDNALPSDRRQRVRAFTSRRVDELKRVANLDSRLASIPKLISHLSDSDGCEIQLWNFAKVFVRIVGM